MRFDVFGRELLVRRREARWEVLDVGSDGAHRVATDIRLPDDLLDDEIRTYLDDLCHENASPRYPRVVRLQ